MIWLDDCGHCCCGNCSLPASAFLAPLPLARESGCSQNRVPSHFSKHQQQTIFQWSVGRQCREMWPAIAEDVRVLASTRRMVINKLLLQAAQLLQSRLTLSSPDIGVNIHAHLVALVSFPFLLAYVRERAWVCVIHYG